MTGDFRIREERASCCVLIDVVTKWEFTKTGEPNNTLI